MRALAEDDDNGWVKRGSGSVVSLLLQCTSFVCTRGLLAGRVGNLSKSFQTLCAVHKNINVLYLCFIVRYYWYLKPKFILQNLRRKEKTTTKTLTTKLATCVGYKVQCVHDFFYKKNFFANKKA